MLSRLRIMAYRAWFFAAGLEDGPGTGESSRRRVGDLLWRLAGACAILFIPYVVLWNWDHASDSTIPVVHVLAAISRAAFVIVLLVFLGTALVAIVRRLEFSETPQK
jgi:hypothetical protein